MWRCVTSGMLVVVCCSSVYYISNSILCGYCLGFQVRCSMWYMLCSCQDLWSCCIWGLKEKLMGKWDLENASRHVQVLRDPKESWCLPCKNWLVFQMAWWEISSYRSSDFAFEFAWFHKSVLWRKLIVTSVFRLPKAFCYRKLYLAFDHICSNVIGGCGISFNCF